MMIMISNMVSWPNTVGKMTIFPYSESTSTSMTSLCGTSFKIIRSSPREMGKQQRLTSWPIHISRDRNFCLLKDEIDKLRWKAVTEKVVSLESTRLHLTTLNSNKSRCRAISNMCQAWRDTGKANRRLSRRITTLRSKDDSNQRFFEVLADEHQLSWLIWEDFQIFKGTKYFYQLSNKFYGQFVGRRTWPKFVKIFLILVFWRICIL